MVFENFFSLAGKVCVYVCVCACCACMCACVCMYACMCVCACVDPQPAILDDGQSACHVEKIVGDILETEADVMFVSHNNYLSWSHRTGLQPALLKKFSTETKTAMLNQLTEAKANFKDSGVCVCVLCDVYN